MSYNFLYIGSTKQIATAPGGMHNIGYVPALMHSGNGRCPRLALTKRRAVDFCRVSTARCRP
jgi:hypothetical protein